MKLVENQQPMPPTQAINGNGLGDTMSGISVITPVYNEEGTITSLYEKVKEVLDGLGKPWELIFVDDGSQDKGPELMKSISLSDARVRLVKLRRNFGQTAALAAGMDHTRGSIIVPMDSDLQNDPADIPRLLSKLDEGYDIVSGWRKSRRDPYLSKILPSFLANTLVSWLTGVHLHDYGCTLKAYRREVLEEVNLYGELHRFIPVLASSIGARITEVEVQHYPRRFGKSKYGTTRMIRGLIDIMTLKLLMAYQTRPMRLFGGLGFSTLGLSVLSGIATLMMKLLTAVDMTGNPLLYVTFFGIISGIQLIGLGFLGEINMRTYFETQRKPIYVVAEVTCQNSHLKGPQAKTDTVEGPMSVQV